MSTVGWRWAQGRVVGGEEESRPVKRPEVEVEAVEVETPDVETRKWGSAPYGNETRE